MLARRSRPFPEASDDDRRTRHRRRDARRDRRRETLGTRMGRVHKADSLEGTEKEVTKLGELQLQQSRAQKKINALLNKEDRSEEETTELREATDSAQKIEIEIRAALVLEDEADKNARAVSLDPEALELRQLTDRSNLGSILGAAVEHRARPKGRKLELQQHHGLSGESDPARIAEVAAGRTSGHPSTDETSEVDQEAVVQPVFANSAGAYLGIYQPTVAMGDAVFPVLTSRPSVKGPFTGSDDAAETTGAWGSELLVPGKNTSESFFWKRRTPPDSLRWTRRSAWL